MTEYQPKTGKRCTCKRGVQRDNCPRCEGTGWEIDFQRIRQYTRIDAGTGRVKPLEDEDWPNN